MAATTDAASGMMAKSWSAAVAAYHARIKSHSQPQFDSSLLADPGSRLPPEIDFLDNQNVGGIAAANVMYFAAVAVAYAFMARRSAGFNLKWVILVYNAICVCLAAYVVYGIVDYKLQTPGSFVCNKPDLTLDGRGGKLAYVVWVYYIQKYFEMLDTIFFILRRSFRQLSFLHIYHHSSITIVTAMFLTFDINGDLYLAALANSFVHVLMYSHYLLSSLGVRAWWRRYITQLQLVQFVLCFIQPAMSLYYGESCGYSNVLCVLMLLYQASMMVLFLNFYRQSYAKRVVKMRQE